MSDEMNYSATIRLNAEPREHRRLVQRLMQDLLEWEVDGQKPIRRVHYRDDIYDGAAVEKSPEVILELNLRDNYSYTLLPSSRSRKGETWRKLNPEELMGGKGFGMNGSHRQHGVLLLAGEGIRPSNESDLNRIPRMQDIMPTILAAMGQKIPSHCDGEVLVDLFHTPPTVQRFSWREQSDASVNLSNDEHEAIKKRLEGLGYL